MEARQLLPDVRLSLVFGGQRIYVSSADETPLFVGKDSICRLSIDRPFVSRIHARIVSNGVDFTLIDESANGTFVRMEDERVVYLHRKRIRLWGSGFLSFGEPLTAASAVRFEHID
jgi:hypothetical protein